jgi:hypothetical protein
MIRKCEHGIYIGVHDCQAFYCTICTPDGLLNALRSAVLFTRLFNNARLRRMVRRQLFVRDVPQWDLADVESKAWAMFWASPFKVSEEDQQTPGLAEKIAYRYLERVAVGAAGDYHDYHNAACRSERRTVSLQAIAERDEVDGTHSYDKALNASTLSRYVPEQAGMKPRRVADCHTDRKHFANGLCESCYQKNYNSSLTEAQKEKRRKQVLAAQKRYADKQKAKHNVQPYSMDYGSPQLSPL